MNTEIRFKAKAKHYDPMVMPENGYVEGCYIEIGKLSVSYSDYESARTVVLKRKRFLIDSAYEMLCWCVEN